MTRKPIVFKPEDTSEDHRAVFKEIIEEYFEQVRDDFFAGKPSAAFRAPDENWEWHFMLLAKFCDDAMYRKPDVEDIAAVL